MSTLTPLDLDRPTRVSAPRRLLALAGAALVAIAWWQVWDTTAELTVTTLEQDGVPLDLLVPAEAVDAPGIVVAHGFSGSRQLMRSTALALADAGFVVAVPDLSGHGANRSPLVRDDEGAGLVSDVLAAVDALAAVPEVRSGPVGLLGHSMGSGAVLRTGIEYPDRIAAVVAVSPTDAEVTPALPGDLLLLAGEREPRFVANARSLLERAVDPDAPEGEGPRRELVVVAGVEHVSILFSARMHAEAATWFATTFDVAVSDDPRPVSPMAWWAVHLVGVVLLWRMLAPVLVDRIITDGGAAGRGLLGAALGGIGATVVVAIIGATVDLTAVGGMLVAPVLAGWLLLAGWAWSAVGARPPRPDGRDLGWAVVLVLVLWLALGAMGPRVWLPASPGGLRLALVLPFVALALPWTLALAVTMQGPRGWRAAGRWVLLAVVTTLTLGLAAGFVPALGFLALLLPLIPVLLSVAVVVWLPVQRPWAGGLATAVLLAWMLALLFPLV